MVEVVSGFSLVSILGWTLAALLITFVSLIILVVVISWASQRADWGHPAINLIDGFIHVWLRYFHRLNNKLIVPEGACIVAANHISGLDPFILTAMLDRPIRFLMARDEYERKGMKRMFELAECIPVERDGRSEFAFRRAFKALKKGEIIGIFPQGKIHLPEQRVESLRPGVFKLAMAAGVPIIPVYIQGVGAVGEVAKAIYTPSRLSVHVYPALDTTVSETELNEKLCHYLNGDNVDEQGQRARK